MGPKGRPLVRCGVVPCGRRWYEGSRTKTKQAGYHQTHQEREGGGELHPGQVGHAGLPRPGVPLLEDPPLFSLLLLGCVV